MAKMAKFPPKVGRHVRSVRPKFPRIKVIKPVKGSIFPKKIKGY